MLALPLLLTGSVPAALADGTVLHDVVKLQRTGCSIAISPRDHQFCVGMTDSVTATVTCVVGSVAVRAPEWFLDGSPIGTGSGLRFTAGEGSHTLSVSCGSCTDQIAITVLPTASCTFVPNLVAAFADSSTEGTTGIFQQANIAAITPGNFNELKFLMRPVTLSGAPADDPSAGGYVLSQTGTNLQVFRTDGTQLTLPDTLQQAELPLSLLVNATAIGTSTLIAKFDSAIPGAVTSTPPGQQVLTTASDSIKVRVGQFPGLAGKSLALYPGFEFMRAINDSSQVKTAIDPTRHAERAGLPYRVYVVAHKTPAQWAANNTLTDVTGGFDTGTVTPGTLAGNVKTVWASGLDGGTAGTVGKPYDVVYDFGQNGTLDPGDLVDGLSYSEAGFHVVRNLTLAGNHPVTEALYTGGSWLGQDLYYPTDIASMGQCPVIVISHGNGHNYQWYDHLGQHLASYGYIVMAHENNTGPGVQTAAGTTLTNTDYLLANQATIQGGVLNGHIDSHRIIWVGHSRGGEGIVLAYDRVWDGVYTSPNFTKDDVILLRPMAPTVFFSPAASNGPDPHDRNTQLITGSADGDVHLGASNPIAQSPRIVEASTGTVMWISVQGSGHGDFHDLGGVATGPDLIGGAATRNISKVYMLCLLEWFARGNPAAKDYLTHLYDDLRSTGLITPASTPPGLVSITWKDPGTAGTVVFDDYETSTGTGTSSSGGAVTFDVSNLSEGNLDDTDGAYTWNPADPFNGCIQMNPPDLAKKGVVFDWTTGQQKFYEEEVMAGLRNFTGKTFLSLRIAQGTRHPETVALNGPLYFSVQLRDAAGHTSTIPSQAFGAVYRPYQRTGEGTGAGWLNEWCTVRMRLADFENDNSQLDLANIVAVTLKFGSSSGSARGRVVVDQIELTNE